MKANKSPSSLLKPHVASAWDTIRRSLARTNKISMFTVFVRLTDMDLVFMPPIGISDKEAYARLISIAASQTNCDFVVMAFEATTAFVENGAPSIPFDVAVVQWKTRDGDEGCEIRRIRINEKNKRVIGDPVVAPKSDHPGTITFSRYFEDIFKQTLH